MTPYSSYKDSGVPWLGEIPAHWEIPQLGRLVRPRNVRNRCDLPLLSVVRERGVILRSITHEDDNHNFIPDDLSNYKVVRAGDLVINKMKAWQGSLGIAPQDGIVSPAYFVLRFNHQNKDFAHLQLRSKPFVHMFARFSDGVRIGQWDLSPYRLKQIPVPTPPPDEQAAIVKYLAHVDRKINRFIQAKRRMIELLNEQKQVLIHQAVTNGLDPDVPMKDSGVEWLGEIPAHWEVKKLKHVASRIVDCLHATPVYSPDGKYPAIRTVDIEPGNVHLDMAKRVDRDHFELWTARLVPRSGDVLYSREGGRYGIAAIVPSGVELCISQRMMIFRIEPPLSSEYMMWQLNTPRIYAEASADIMGAASPHVNIETIKNFLMIVPPTNEQTEIAQFIRDELDGIDKAVSRVGNEIDLIREYRTRLVSDVVTGKLDVREAATGLPEIDAEEHQLIEEMPDSDEESFDDELLIEEKEE